MLRAALLVATLTLLLAGCAGSCAQDAACAAKAHSDVRWGYPGYGCGPVPRAQTHFS